MRIVTTYPPKDWDIYVKRNIESWVDNLDAEIIVYAEDDRGRIPGTETRALGEVSGVKEFLRTIRAFPPAHGQFGNKYDYNFDAWKFCRKVFAQFDAAQGYDGLLVWLDADVECLQPITEERLASMVNTVGLYQRKDYHSECGIVLFNLPAAQGLMMAYRNLYTSGYIFRYPMGWHDCWALDLAIERLDVKADNLSPQLSEGLEVVSASVLGPYFRHDKGQRKYARTG